MASTTPSRLWTSLRSLPDKQQKLPSYYNTFSEGLIWFPWRQRKSAQNYLKGCSADLGEQGDLHCWWNWLVWFSIWEPGLFKWKHEGGRKAGQDRGLAPGPGPVGWLLGGDRSDQVSSIWGNGQQSIWAILDQWRTSKPPSTWNWTALS